jgi:hypothetical protein
MQAKVFIDSKADYQAVRSLSLDQIFQGDGYIEIVTNATELDQLKQLGLRTEIVHDDLTGFYQSRLTPDKDMGGYMTLAEVNAAVFQIVADHPTITHMVTIGTTIEGRPIRAVKISDAPETNEDEPEVMITAAIHAREVITPLVLLNAMDYLTDNYGVLPEITELVDSREMWFVPVVNADGYYYNQVIEPNGGGMWRKNRRDNLDGTFGVDLNRNFGYEWGYDDEGSDPSSSGATYRGPSAFSEPETQNMRDFTIAHQFVTTLYFHAHGNLVIYPWGYDYFLTPDDNLFGVMADSMVAYNSYDPRPAHGLYPANGVTDDWGYGEQFFKNKNMAFTVEVGNGADGFWPNPSRIPALIAENLGVILFAASSADNLYGLLPPDPPTASVADTVDGASYNVTWTSDDTVNPVVYFELVEMAGYQRQTDPCNGFDNWVNDGFALSSAHSHSTPNALHSGTGDGLSNHCTSEVPIAVAVGDTLRMWLWYDIETDWDYAYVEASLDGTAFTSLEGNVTTTSDPNDQNLGHGITGSSSGWVEAFFDISAYAGQDVFVRLSYITDGYVQEPGIWFDDIYPVDGFEFGIIVASDLEGNRYTFYDRPSGEYFYKVRGQDAEGQWSQFSPIVSTVVVGGEEICYDTDGDGFGDPDHPENTCPDDNCPNTYNPGQIISGGLSMGDACCCLMRGDISRNGDIDIVDLIDLVQYMFQGGLPAACPSEADIDGSGGNPDIVDLIHLVQYMFQRGPVPQSCP